MYIKRISFTLLQILSHKETIFTYQNTVEPARNDILDIKEITQKPYLIKPIHLKPIHLLF